jgi:hypothetical protein
MQETHGSVLNVRHEQSGRGDRRSFEFQSFNKQQRPDKHSKLMKEIARVPTRFLGVCPHHPILYPT